MRLVRVALLLRPVLIVTEDLIDDSREGLQLRTPDRLLPAIPRRQAVAQHLAHRLSGQPEAARRRALAPPLHLHAAPHRRIELHSIHPSCVPQNTLGMLGGPLGSMRRYVPVVLPLTMLFGALTVVTLLARVAAATYRRGLTLATGALLVGLVARPSVAVVGQPLWDDALAQTAQVARLFPDQAVVLVSPDLAGTHIPTSLQLFRVTRTDGPDRTALDVGTPADALLYDLRGFHAPARDQDPARGTFRWTGPRASLTLPGGRDVTLVVAGGPAARHAPIWPRRLPKTTANTGFCPALSRFVPPSPASQDFWSPADDAIAPIAKRRWHQRQVF